QALVPTIPEIRYLLARLLLKSPGAPPFIIAWSIWRRRHQAKAAEAHYKSRKMPVWPKRRSTRLRPQWLLAGQSCIGARIRLNDSLYWNKKGTMVEAKRGQR